MRLSIELNTIGSMASGRSGPDPASPNLSYLGEEAALKSFFATVERIVADNPVAVPRLMELAGKARSTPLSPAEAEELKGLQVQALRQGRAVGSVLGFFLKLRPYQMLEEIRRTAKLFQPAFGPVLVVEGDTVREVFERDQDFTVEPYGVEMTKVMSPQHNGGFSTFVLSTDDSGVYEPDKRLLTLVCNRGDADRIVNLVHEECVRRVGESVAVARASGAMTIDVVDSIARFVPVVVGHKYLGVPVAAQPGSFALTPEMLTYYGSPIDGQAATALEKSDGVIPDGRQMYLWIKAAFRHFFNNVQKDPAVQIEGLRACRQLLAYLLREIAIQRQRILDGQPTDDTMLTRLVHFQLGRSVPAAERPQDLDPRLVSDLRIAENVMGTIVGAIAGQEEATCRAIDSMLRLQEGKYKPLNTGAYHYGTFDEATQLARGILAGKDVAPSRVEMHKYFREALRLQPQGEVLLRRCAREGATIAGGRPIPVGTPVFVAHGSAMKDVPEPDAFILGRPREHYLQHGWGRHTCLGQFVSPVIIVESMIAVLGLQDLARPRPRAGEHARPLERRFGRLQLDDQNLYATTFSLKFADEGATRQFWP